MLSFYTALIIKTISEDTARAGIEKNRASFIRRVKEKIKTKIFKVVNCAIYLHIIILYIKINILRNSLRRILRAWNSPVL